MPQPARSLTYAKLVAAMFMWGGTWIAGRIIAQELSAPLAGLAVGIVGLHVLAAGSIALAEWRLWPHGDD